ncbi:MAG: hypothetical protein WAV41_04110 [Microgenomates group bacterium]
MISDVLIEKGEYNIKMGRKWEDQIGLIVRATADPKTPVEALRNELSCATAEFRSVEHFAIGAVLRGVGKLCQIIS